MAKVFYSRSKWKARTPGPLSAQGSVREAFIHHSDDRSGRPFNTMVKQCEKMRGIQNYHMDSNGWSDIGYHYVVFQYLGVKTPRAESRIFRARPVAAVPAAQAGHNTNTLAICVIGDGNSESLERNTRYAIECILRAYPTLRRLGGHRDVVATSCPGNKFYSSIGHIANVVGLGRVQ